MLLAKLILLHALSMNEVQPAGRSVASDAIDPATAMAVTQFAFSAYKIFSGGGKDPIATIVGMLTDINNKLNIINEKLDTIILYMKKVPERTLYLGNVQKLNTAHRQANVIFNDLGDFKRRYDKEALQKFREAKHQTIMLYRKDIHDAFNNLREFYDPLTVSYIVYSAKLDYELSNLIGIERSEINNQMREYLDYFKKSLWLSNNNLDSQLVALRITRKELAKDPIRITVPWKNNISLIQVWTSMAQPIQVDYMAVEDLAILESLRICGLIEESDLPYEPVYYQAWREEHKSIMTARKYVEYGRQSVRRRDEILAERKKAQMQVIAMNYHDIVVNRSAYYSAMEAIKFLGNILSKND